MLAPSKENQTDLVAYYADHGLKSIVDYQNFEPLHQLLSKSGPVSGLLLSYHAFNGNQFLLTAVSEFILPDGFRVTDIVRDIRNKAVPILYVAPRKTFNDKRFVGLKLVARFNISEFSVDPVAVHVSNNPQHFHHNNFQYSSQPLVHQNHGYHSSHQGFVYYPNQEIRPSQGRPSQEQHKPNQQQNVQK
ncbi:uncharacterized protein [Halyomorpha halys]|uniref:uncharacterized protein n=1 Tax=Halyomorpha halys TaxID=286706 RepID=UPI0006D52142|nr:uncharacterized protein LOC106692847 [Halyomorpha halys]